MQQKLSNLPTTPTLPLKDKEIGQERELDWLLAQCSWTMKTDDPLRRLLIRRWRIERGLITPLLCDLLLERKTLISDFDGQWKRDSKWLTGTKANIPFPLACLPMTHRCLPGSSKSLIAQNSKAEKPFLSVSGTNSHLMKFGLIAFFLRKDRAGLKDRFHNWLLILYRLTIKAMRLKSGF